MQVKGKTILLYAATALVFGGCFKSVSYDTTYILRPYVQTKNQGDFTSLAGVKAYAFAADTTDWEVASYEDALAGILSSKHVLSDRLTPVATAEPYPQSTTIPSSVNWLQMQLQGSLMMIVAVDVEHKLYAYRNQEFAENLSPYIISIPFRSWRTSYTDGGWRIVNEFYTAPDTQPDVTPDPEEDSETDPVE